MTAQYQVHPSQIKKVKESIRSLVTHVKNHEPLTTIYIAQQEILDSSKFMHILRFEDEVSKYSYMWREGGQFSTEKYSAENHSQNRNN